MGYKNDHNSKNINWKNQKFYFSFHSIDYTTFMWISTLTKKIIGIYFVQILKHFWKKYISKDFLFQWGASLPTKSHPGAGYSLLRLVDPSRNRLVSTALFAIVFIVLHAWVCINQNQKINVCFQKWSNVATWKIRKKI